MHTIETSLTADIARPTYVSHPTIDALCNELRCAGRDELVHYAGASYRDDVAWAVCQAWLADRNAPESELLSRAYKATGWGDIAAKDIRRAHGYVDGLASRGWRIN